MATVHQDRRDRACDPLRALWTALCAGTTALLLSTAAVAGPVDVADTVTAAGAPAGRTTIVIERLSDGQRWIANPDRAQQPFSPASTSKIPHSLIALQTGVATPVSVFRWDGVPRSFRRWNRDHTLASAFQNSVVWVYQQIARDAGSALMSDWLRRFDYGNANVGTDAQLTTYWLDGTLRISAAAQVTFLSKVARGRLPLSPATYAAVRDFMRSDTGPGWSLQSKTGWWYSETDMDIGWFVGWLDCADDTYVFALNMDMPDTRSLALRKSVTYATLRDIGALACD